MTTGVSLLNQYVLLLQNVIEENRLLNKKTGENALKNYLSTARSILGDESDTQINGAKYTENGGQWPRLAV
jgi:hypothetical protein